MGRKEKEMIQILLAGGATLLYVAVSDFLLKESVSFTETIILYLLVVLLYDSIERRRHDRT